MAEQTLMSRVRGWFNRSRMDDQMLSDLPPEGHVPDEAQPRNSLFRPFAKRDAAIQSLHAGFVTLTDLMVGIRENLERQGKRQDELLEHLSRLPAVLEQLPESARVQGETLKALHQELAGQHEQQKRLTEILDHVGKSSTQQRDVLEGLQDRVDRMRQTDEQIASNLVNVGTTMQELGRSTTTGAQILESMRDNMASRDNDLQHALAKQGTRFTVMLSIAIFLSVAALVAVAIVGYLLLAQRQAG
jgi:chromosome segregation ATPase